MAAFRILNQSPVFFLLDGVTPAAGGRLEFYSAGTTTAKDVYGDKSLTVNNGSMITLGTDGRAADDIWGSGSYRVRLYAADDTLIADDDNVEIPGGDGAAIPALQSGKFLTNDGAVLQWDSVLQPPDPTGQSGKVLGSDGTNLAWVSGAPSITAGTKTVTLGSVLIQTGTATCTASNASTATKGFTFPTPFSELWHVEASPNCGSNTTALGYLPIVSVNGRSVNGATFNIDVNVTEAIITDVPFTWLAIGLA